jgi:hypothetical protein
MDVRGARHLAARLAAGAVGQRVEIVSVAEGANTDARPGEAGMVVSIEEAGALVLLDSGAEVVVDFATVRARRFW